MPSYREDQQSPCGKTTHFDSSKLTSEFFVNLVFFNKAEPLDVSEETLAVVEQAAENLCVRQSFMDGFDHC